MQKLDPTDYKVLQSCLNMMGKLVSMPHSNMQFLSSNFSGILTIASQATVSHCAAISHLNALRQDALVQKQIEKLLKELAESVKTIVNTQTSLRVVWYLIELNGQMSTFVWLP